MSLFIYIFGVLIVVTAMLSSYFLGERSKDHDRAGAYESGIKGFGPLHLPYFAHYLTLGILFVIFDMESVFLYLWSTSIVTLGWPGFLKVSFFIGMLVLGLIYAIRVGTLNLVSKPAKRVN
jgi:NADH-quinone oxidoreductase subunit A